MLPGSGRRRPMLEEVALDWELFGDRVYVLKYESGVAINNELQGRGE
jgi:hypothetical protein